MRNDHIFSPSRGPRRLVAKPLLRGGTKIDDLEQRLEEVTRKRDDAQRDLTDAMAKYAEEERKKKVRGTKMKKGRGKIKIGSVIKNTACGTGYVVEIYEGTEYTWCFWEDVNGLISCDLLDDVMLTDSIKRFKDQEEKFKVGDFVFSWKGEDRGCVGVIRRIIKSQWAIILNSEGEVYPYHISNIRKVRELTKEDYDKPWREFESVLK